MGIQGNISKTDHGKIWAVVLQGLVRVQLPSKVGNGFVWLSGQSQSLYALVCIHSLPLPYQVLYKLVSPSDSLPLGVCPSSDKRPSWWNIALKL